MIFSKHETACIEPEAKIGPESSVGAYSIVRGRVVVGARCGIDEAVLLAEGVEIGDEVRVGPRAYLRHCMVAGGVTIGPHACLEGLPDSRILIRRNATVGAQSTIRAGTSIGENSIIEPGAVVAKDVPASAIVTGNPARIIGYSAITTMPGALNLIPQEGERVATSVRGVSVHYLPLIEDLRGNLSFGEVARHIPFEVKRYFLTFDVASEQVRGEHAHRRLHQFLLCVSGRLHIMVDDGAVREEFILDRPNIAVYIPPLIWSVQYRFAPGAVLMALCSHRYDSDDYIRDYSDFLNIVRDELRAGRLASVDGAG